MKDVELKPCPFCGADARGNNVECSNGCVEQIFPFMTEEEAIEEWNRRVDNG